MSAPPFFQSAGRGDLKFWGEDDGPTVVVWESLSESEQEQWSEKMGKSKDWVVWCRSREKDEEQHPFEDGCVAVWLYDHCYYTCYYCYHEYFSGVYCLLLSSYQCFLHMYTVTRHREGAYDAEVLYHFLGATYPLLPTSPSNLYFLLLSIA